MSAHGKSAFTLSFDATSAAIFFVYAYDVFTDAADVACFNRSTVRLPMVSSEIPGGKVNELKRD